MSHEPITIVGVDPRGTASRASRHLPSFDWRHGDVARGIDLSKERVFATLHGGRTLAVDEECWLMKLVDGSGFALSWRVTIQLFDTIDEEVTYPFDEELKLFGATASWETRALDTEAHQVDWDTLYDKALARWAERVSRLGLTYHWKIDQPLSWSRAAPKPTPIARHTINLCEAFPWIKWEATSPIVGWVGTIREAEMRVRVERVPSGSSRDSYDRFYAQIEPCRKSPRYIVRSFESTSPERAVSWVLSHWAYVTKHRPNFEKLKKHLEKNPRFEI